MSIKDIKSAEEPFSTERAWMILKALADTPCPSQTVSYSRALVISRMLAHYGQSEAAYLEDYLNTGNAALLMGDQARPPMLVFAHLDQVSYMVGPKIDDGRYQLAPYCTHLAQNDVKALVLRYNVEIGSMEQIGCGVISSEPDGDALLPLFTPSEGLELQMGDRLIFDHPMQREADGSVFGHIDNAAGVTACLMAALALLETRPQTEVGFIFTDEEEGPSQTPRSFARGARRLMGRIQPPGLCIVVDGHNDNLKVMGKGALYAERSGEGRSAVTPPHLFARFQRLMNELNESGIPLHPNPGRISRSDDVALISYTANILNLGYPAANSHFDQGPSSANLNDLVALARTIYWLVIRLEDFACQNATVG